MPTMTVKEWAAAYQAANEWEPQERLIRLPLEPIEESVRSYFALSTMVLALADAANEPEELWELRLKHYQAMAGKWKRLAQR